MTKKSLTLATTLLFVLGMFAVLASPASAGTTYLQDNFDTHETNDGLLIGDTPDIGTDWVENAAYPLASIGVGAGFGQGGTLGAGKACHPDCGGKSTLNMFSGPFASTGKVYLNYDFKVPTPNNPGSAQPQLKDSVQNSYSAFTIAHANPANRLGINHEGGGMPGTSGNKDNVFAAVPQNVNFQAVYDLDANTIDVTVEDLDNPANVLIPTYQITGVPFGFTPNSFMIFQNGGGIHSNMGMDNLRIADFAVPEPSSLILLSLGCVALLATRRRRQA